MHTVLAISCGNTCYCHNRTSHECCSFSVHGLIVWNGLPYD